MSYVSISNWTVTDWTPEMEALAREKYVPLVMSVGAKSVKMVRTSDSSFSVVTTYKDEATAKSAAAKIAEIRAQAAGELPMKMVDVVAGEVFAKN